MNLKVRMASDELRPVRPLVLTTAGLVGFCALGSQRLVDQDLFGHLVFGRDAVAAGHVVQHDPYSYLPTLPVWYNHEWLSEGVMWLTYAAGGDRGLLLVKAACGALMFLCIAVVALRRGAHPLGVLAVLALATVDLGPNVHVRPYVATYTNLAVTLLLLEMAEGGARWAWAALAALLAIWANEHAGFVVGLGIAGLYAVAAAVARSKVWKGHLLASAAGALGACANPYGPAYWPFVLRAVTMKRPYITEFKPVPLDLQSFLFYKAVLVLTAITLIARWIWTEEPQRSRLLAPTLVLAVTAWLSWFSYRHVPIFLIAAGAFAPELLTSALQRCGVRLPARPATALPWVLGALGASLYVGMASVSSHFGLWLPTKPGLATFVFPTDAVRFLKLNGLHGNIANFFDWGEFLIWEMPDSKVAFDGRLETVYPPATIDLNLHFTYNEPGGEALLTEHPTDIVLAHVETSAFRKLMPSHPDWIMIYHDSTAAVFIRASRQRERWNYPLRQDPAELELTGPPTLR